MKHLLTKSSLLGLLLATSTPGQGQATTLTRLSQRADVIVVATVSTTLQVSPEWQQVQFQTGQAIKGQIASQFILREPAGKCCGRGLFDLIPGNTRLLFLKRVGPTLHPIGGHRGILPSSSELLHHVQSVVTAPTTNQLARFLAANINHVDNRIANDATLALATLPNLSLTPIERLHVANALTQSVQTGSTRTAALADITARLNDANAVDTMMPIYLSATREDQALLLRKALHRCSAPLVADRLPAFVGTKRNVNLRAATLLTDLPSTTALSAMTNLLQRPNHPQVKTHLCEGLLAAGVSSAALSPLVPDAVLKLATKRLNRRPVFRNINPRR